MANRVQDVAGDVSAEEGEVILDGPNGVAVSMTPAAARRTGESLTGAADKAIAQQKRKDSALR